MKKKGSPKASAKKLTSPKPVTTKKKKTTPPKVSPKQKKVFHNLKDHNPKDEEVVEEEDDEEFVPDENEEDDEQNTIQELLKSVLSNQKNREIPDDESDLLRDDPEAKALLRNTALNSFGPGEHVSEKAIEKKIREIKQKEKAHLDMVNIQRYVMNLENQADDDDDEEDEDISVNNRAKGTPKKKKQ